MHCTEDSPLFYAVWYVLAILVATGLGALPGVAAAALVGFFVAKCVDLGI